MNFFTEFRERNILCETGSGEYISLSKGTLAPTMGIIWLINEGEEVINTLTDTVTI